jgi:hypothetical protein
MSRNRNKSKNKPAKPNPLAEIKPDYAEFYRRTFPSQRHLVESVLEIGFNMESLQALSKLFPNALIHTLDMFEGKSVTKQDVENAGFFVYAMDEKVGGAKGLSLASISSKFDIIIDRSVVYGASELMVFNQLYTNNVRDHGLYYIERLNDGPLNDQQGQENLLIATVKALFDADRTFSNKYLNQESIDNLINITEWCDTDPTEKIAVFKKRKTEQKREKRPEFQQAPVNATAPAAVFPNLAPAQKQATLQKPNPSVKNEYPEPEIEAELVLPKILTAQLFEKTPTVIQNPTKYGQVKKNIFASFFGKVHEAPALYEMYGLNSDYFFADIAQGSDRYNLEMARSIFTFCNNDRRILDALLNETIPVILATNYINVEFWANSQYPCMIICHPNEIQLELGKVYRNSDLKAQYIINGRKLLKKFAV